MTTAGYILAAIGMLLGLAGDVMILAAVYRRGVILFVACLIVPFAAWAFALVNSEIILVDSSHSSSSSSSRERTEKSPTTTRQATEFL